MPKITARVASPDYDMVVLFNLQSCLCGGLGRDRGARPQRDGRAGLDQDGHAGKPAIIIRVGGLAKSENRVHGSLPQWLLCSTGDIVP